MSTNNLKQNFETDLQTIKTLNLNIMPAKIYYPFVFSSWLAAFSLVLIIQGVIVWMGTSINAWPYVNAHTQWKLDSKKNDIEQSERFMKMDAMTVKEEKEFEKESPQRLAKAYKEINHDREYYHEAQVGKMILGIIANSFLFMFFLVGKIKHYIIFRCQIKDKLKSGQYLDRAMKIGAAIWLTSFTLFSTCMLLLMEQDLAFFATIPAFIASGLLTSVLIQMEISRIGVSLISTAVSQFFESRGKPVENSV